MILKMLVILWNHFPVNMYGLVCAEVQTIAITGIKATFTFQKGEDEYLKLGH